MFKRNILIIIFIPFFLISYDNQVDSIIITGNNKTKKHVILREVLHPVNQELDSVLMKEDINRLYNLGIFSSVDIKLNKNAYEIMLVESFSIIPDLVIDHSEITDQWSYGLGLAHINFMGLNQDLYIGGAFIGEKWFAAALSNPWIYGDHVSFTTRLYNRFSDNPFYNYRYNETYFSIKTGFFTNLNNQFEYGLSFYRNKKKTLSNLIPLQEKNIYDYLNFEFDYQYDSRDVYNDPTKGLLYGLNLRFSKSLLEINPDIVVFNIFYDKYILLDIKHFHEPVISYGLHSLVKFPKFSELPIHEYEYIGGVDYIRGYSSNPYDYPDNFDKSLEVSNLIYNYIEFQSTVLKKRDYGKIEFGMDGILFFNSGIGSKSVKDLSVNNLLFGYGIGLKFFITGPPPISIMIGFNPYGQNFIHIED